MIFLVEHERAQFDAFPRLRFDGSIRDQKRRMWRWAGPICARVAAFDRQHLVWASHSAIGTESEVVGLADPMGMEQVRRRQFLEPHRWRLGHRERRVVHRMI
jgi:hypothetical protein